MERLTFEGDFCTIAMCTLVPGGSFCEDVSCSQRKVWERLKNYEDMEEQGRLMALPCKMGDLLWGIRWFGTNGKVQQAPVIGMRFLDDMTLSITLGKVCSGEYGKGVFPTREEAEKALLGLRLAEIPEEEPDEIDKAMIAKAQADAEGGADHAAD